MNDGYKCMDCVHHGGPRDKCCCPLPCRNNDKFRAKVEKPVKQTFELPQNPTPLQLNQALAAEQAHAAEGRLQRAPGLPGGDTQP